MFLLIRPEIGVRNPGAHDARAAGVFIAPQPRRHASGSFFPDRSRPFPAVSPPLGHIIRTTSPSNYIALRYDPNRDSSRSRVDAELARVACGRASPTRRRSRSRFSCLSRDGKFLPRTRRRVVRRLTRVPLPTQSNPPQMASKDGSTFFFTSESVNEGHPDKLADQVRDRALVDSGALATRTVAFSPDGIAKSSRGDAEVSRPPRASRRVSDVPLTRLPPHTSPQISDGVLDACLAQDPDSKVRLRPRKRSPIELAKKHALPKRFSRHARRRGNARGRAGATAFPPREETASSIENALFTATRRR